MGTWRGTPKGTSEGFSKNTWKGNFFQGQVWFSLQLKLNSLELNSEVGRLVKPTFPLIY